MRFDHIRPQGSIYCNFNRDMKYNSKYLRPETSSL